MIEQVKIETTYDPVTKRHRAQCPLCPHFSVRAKREAAEHVESQHVTYEHEAEVVR